MFKMPSVSWGQNCAYDRQDLITILILLGGASLTLKEQLRSTSEILPWWRDASGGVAISCRDQVSSLLVIWGYDIHHPGCLDMVYHTIFPVELTNKLICWLAHRVYDTCCNRCHICFQYRSRLFYCRLYLGFSTTGLQMTLHPLHPFFRHSCFCSDLSVPARHLIMEGSSSAENKSQQKWNALHWKPDKPSTTAQWIVNIIVFS